MSCDDRVPLGSQIKVSFGGKTDVWVTPARHCGIGATGTGLALPCPELMISPDNRAVAHLVGSRSPPRPRTKDGPSSKVSHAGVLELQFADGVNVDVCAKALLDASTIGESAIVKASVLGRGLALRGEETKNMHYSEPITSCCNPRLRKATNTSSEPRLGFLHC